MKGITETVHVASIYLQQRIQANFPDVTQLRGNGMTSYKFDKGKHSLWHLV